MEQNTPTTSAHEFVLDDFLAPPLTKKGEFRLKSTMMFLTYPKCDMEKQVWLDAFTGKKFDYYVICRELHQDGTPHLHVLLKNHKVQFDVTSEKTFDVLGFHPNIRKVKPGPGHLERVIGYMKKYDTQCLTNMPPQECYSTKEGVYKEALKAGSRKRAREIIMDGDAEGYFKSHTNIERVLESFPQPVEPWIQPTCYQPFIYPPEVLKWASQINNNSLDRFKLLVIRGTSSQGKTRMMRSIDPYHLYIDNFPMMSKLNSTGYKYIIWDDVDWSRTPGIMSVDPEHWRNVLLGKDDGATVRTTHAKYQNIMTRVPSVIIMNPSKGAWMWSYLHKHSEWSRECIFLDLPDDHLPLYVVPRATF